MSGIADEKTGKERLNNLHKIMWLVGGIAAT